MEGEGEWILDEEKLKQPRWSQFEHKLREFRKAEQKKQEQDLEALDRMAAKARQQKKRERRGDQLSGYIDERDLPSEGTEEVPEEDVEDEPMKDGNAGTSAAVGGGGAGAGAGAGTFGKKPAQDATMDDKRGNDKPAWLQGEEEEDFMYDPEEDDRMEEWAEKRLPVKARKRDERVSCPMCFTILSDVAQPHAKYENQYRAVFVDNVKVDSVQPLVRAGKTFQQWSGSSGRTSTSTKDSKGAPAIEIFYPAQCAICGTQVGVQDRNNVFHFYDVLLS